jgi:DNA-binding NtrC family response regulator
MNKNIRGVEPEAMKIFAGYHWPGNIRELENTIERAVLLAEVDMITSDDLNLFFEGERRTDNGTRIRLPENGLNLADAERDLIEEALQRSSWVQKDAARLLGISSRALNYKIRQFGFTHAAWKRNK